MRIGTIDLNKLQGLSDKSIGLVKEFWGTVLDRDQLVKEGEAQQEKGAERLRALRAELEAQKHETKAKANEQRQKAAQRAKENAA